MRRRRPWMGVLIVALSAWIVVVAARDDWRLPDSAPVSASDTIPSQPRPRLTAPLTAAPGAQLRTVDLVDLPWQSARTGWLVLADQDTPLRDYSFTYEEMLVAGEQFKRGLSVYPFSEIVYDLDGHGERLTARLGVTDDSKSLAGSVHFAVYGDEFLLYESDVVRAGEPARELDVSLAGIHELRLVVDDGGDGSLGDYGLWAEPQLQWTDGAPSEDAVSAIQQARQELEVSRAADKAAERNAATTRGRALRDALERAGGPAGPATARFDATASSLILTNDRAMVSLGYGGARNGLLSIMGRDDDVPRLFDASPVTTVDGNELRLAGASPLSSDGYSITRTTRLLPTARGAVGGVQVEARYRTAASGTLMRVSLLLLDGDPAVTLSVTAEGVQLRTVRYLGNDGAQVPIGDGIQFLTDRSHLYRGVVRDDGYDRKAPLEATKPALLWSDVAERGLLFAFYDHVPSPAWLTFRRDPGRQGTQVAIELTASLDDFGPVGAAPPPLTIELANGTVGRDTFARYRAVTGARYPAQPWPEGARYQWGSWYAFGPGVRAQPLLENLEILDRSFGDLGTWQFVVDAGWFIQYGREDAELSAVDFEKFPEGVRAIADAVHARGMQMPLYLGTGFIHDSPGNGGEWLALRGMIDKHPDWLIPFQHEQSNVHRYLLDYHNPDVKEYLADLIRDYFEVHGADGISLDGLTDAEGQLIPRAERDTPTGPPHPLLPALDVYKLVRELAERYYPNAYIESSWADPSAANPYAHIFRYGDESDQVDSPYPFSGFLQRLDYAIFSRMALGQRASVGTSTGNPDRPLARWWLQAATALGADATISFDLRTMDATAIAQLRADLRPMVPFEGTTTFGPGLFPDTFATARDGTTWVGVVNRDAQSRPIPVQLEPLGLGTGRPYAAFDVTDGSGRRIDSDFTMELPGRSFRLLALRATPGPLWSDSAVSDLELKDGAGLALTASGPTSISGTMRLATPPPASVSIDGVTLTRAERPSPNQQFSYDAASGVLSLAYDHRSARRIEIHW